MVKRKRKHMLLQILWLVECLSWRQFFAELFSHEAIINVFGLRLKKPPHPGQIMELHCNFNLLFLTGKGMHI